MESENFRVRRKDREISRAEAENVLREAEYGTIAMLDPENGEPYGVPVSFAFYSGAIFIHGADAGRKFRILSSAPKVHFSAACRVSAVFTRYFTSFYASAMVFGQVVPVENEAEKREALRAICQKYLPERMDVADEHIAHSIARTTVFKIVPEAITGKAKRPEKP